MTFGPVTSVTFTYCSDGAVTDQGAMALSGLIESLGGTVASSLNFSGTSQLSFTDTTIADLNMTGTVAITSLEPTGSPNVTLNMTSQ